MTPVCTVLVLGDPMRGDDGAALLAAQRLEAAAIPDCRIRHVGQLGPDDLVAALTEGRCLVLDAVRGVPPGEVVELPLARVADGKRSAAGVLPRAATRGNRSPGRGPGRAARCWDVSRDRRRTVRAR